MKKLGKVIEVFIPNENNINIMYSRKIGFKISINEEIIELIKDNSEKYASIYKDDLVEIIDENNDLDIKIYIGDNHDR